MTKKKESKSDSQVVDSTSTSQSTDNPLVSQPTEDLWLITSQQFQKDKIEKAMYNFNVTDKKNIWSTTFTSETGTINTAITPERLDDLALNAQMDMNKIQQINNYVRYMINKNDILGKVYETVEGNVNTNWELTSAKISEDVDEETIIEINGVIKECLENMDIERVIAESLPLCFIEGNYIMYLKKDIKNMDFQVDYYPIGVAEISDYKVGGENKIIININELRARLNKMYKKTNKNTPLFYKDVEEEVKNIYPSEVWKAFLDRSQFAVLDIKNTGVLRINNFGRKYGVSPVFRALKPAIRLENVEIADDKNTSARGKKIIFQKLSSELMKDGAKNLAITWAQAQVTAHEDLITALKAPNVSVFTGLPWTESVTYVEPKIEQTNVNTKSQYRNDIMTSVGISFLNSDSTTTYASSQITIKELSKTLNKITKQLEKIIDKWIKNILIDLKYDLKYAPKFRVGSGALIEEDAKMALASFMFDKMGASYSSVYEILDRDIDTEVMKRKKENEDKLDEVFKPRANAFNSNGNELQNTNTDTTTPVTTPSKTNKTTKTNKGGRPSGIDDKTKTKDLNKTVKDKQRVLEKSDIENETEDIEGDSNEED